MNTVVCANLSVREKLNILRTMVDISSCGPETKKRFKDLLRDIMDYSPTRNMIAHDYFLPGEDAVGIGFMTTKAKGRFDTPTVMWAASDFAKECRKLEEFQEEAMQLVIALEHATFSAEELNIPMKLTHSSARQHRHDHQHQGDPGSGQASGQTPPETPGETQA
jgi:hypothetical protein